jgi:GNAT superfamily N-acetyltransferase
MTTVEEFQPPRASATPSRLSSSDVPEIVAVFSDAFRDYPVMRHVLGHTDLYEPRLDRLVELFVNGRAYRNEPMLGVRDDAGRLIGAATTTLPTVPDPPAAFVELREAMWAELGADARARYEAFIAATQQFPLSAPHYHLNMIGVRRAHQGQGLARSLLDAVHTLSDESVESSGVSLTTELPANVELYRHFGYEIHGHARVADELETWVLFRPRRRA